MKQDLKERIPVWAPVLPVTVLSCVFLVLLFSRYLLRWFDVETCLGIPIVLRYSIGLLFIGIGLLYYVWGFKDLKPAGTVGCAKSLRDKGAYGLTRNPMYFGGNALFWGTAIVLDNLVLLLAACIWLFGNYLVIVLWEEKQLIRKFGEEYREYKRRVPRFFPVNLRRRKSHEI